MKTLYALAILTMALFSSPKADAAQFVLRYDGQTNLYSRVLDGSVDTDLRRVHTGHNLVTGEPIFYEMAYMSGTREVKKYAVAYACASRLDVSACRIRKSKDTK